MTRRTSLAVLALSALVALATGCGSSTPHPASTATAALTPVGHWREFWGVPGETDVAYHDEYQVSVEGGRAFAVPVNQEDPDRIDTVTIDGDNFDMVIHTSFDVHYQLHLDPGGASMSGTATTPEKVVPIRWERLSP